MTRNLCLFTFFALLSFSTLLSTSSATIMKRASTISSSKSISSSTSSSSITASSTSTSVPASTPPHSNSDDGDSSGFPVMDSSYYENQGASGDSSAYFKIPLGAQIGIIISVVLVGIGGLVGCIMFYLHKKKQWEAAAVRRRTANVRSLILATKLQKGEEERGRGKTRTDGEGGKSGNGRSTSGRNNNRSTGVRAVDVEQGGMGQNGQEESGAKSTKWFPGPWRK